MNSALLTTNTPYAVPTNFYPGIANTIEIPIVGGILSSQQNFQLDGTGHLQYIGAQPANIELHSTFVLGFIQPHPDDPSGSLDEGPLVTVYVYAQVASTNGNVARHDVTFYLVPFEYEISNYTININDVFTFNPNDSVKFYAYYVITRNAPPPFDPTNFYVTLNTTYLSICASSSVTNVDYNVVPFLNSNVLTNVEIPIGSNVNTMVYKFKPKVNGLSFLQARINIPSAVGYINSSGVSTVILNVNWELYLSINGVLLPQYVSVESSGNQPFVLNSPSNVFTSTLLTNLLADLRPTDEVEIICNCTDVFVLVPTPPFFINLTDGKIIADFSINTIANKRPLYPHGLLQSVSDNSLVIPLNTDISTAVEFPLTNANLNFGENFTYSGGVLTYTGTHPSWVKVSAAINLSDMQLNTADSDPVTVFLSTYGFFIGIAGQSYNNLVTETNIYRDVTGTLKLLSNQTTENVLRMRPGDNISLLFYTYDTIYTSVEPSPGVPVKTPALGSTITITGNINLTIE
jgi:hypothetical protein